MSWQETLTEINTWSVAERMNLVHAVWDSIATESPDVLLSDALKAELDRRIAEDDADPNDVLTWEEVHRAVRQTP